MEAALADGRDAHATDVIDSFRHDPTNPQVDGGTRNLFLGNCCLGSHEAQIRLYEGLSQEVLAWMIKAEGYWESFDFIYVDGGHHAKDVLSDAVMSWKLLKIGGILVFDDYGWGDWLGDSRLKPRLGIDSFEAVYGDRMELVATVWRRAFR